MTKASYSKQMEMYLKAFREREHKLKPVPCKNCRPENIIILDELSEDPQIAVFGGKCNECKAKEKLKGICD